MHTKIGTQTNECMLASYFWYLNRYLNRCVLCWRHIGILPRENAIEFEMQQSRRKLAYVAREQMRKNDRY